MVSNRQNSPIWLFWSYVYKFIVAGPYIINLRRTWEKLLLAARAIAAIEHPAEVFVISSRPYGQRAVLKFAAHTGATAIAGRFTPGAFTNQIQVCDLCSFPACMSTSHVQCAIVVALAFIVM